MAGDALLQAADARRDAGDWAGAAAAYAAHLAAHPRDWPIWIQHGHCVKEAGDPAGALASYRRAEEGLPGDADLRIQVGHALKLTGDLAGARAAYGQALVLDPTGPAWREVVPLLGHPLPPAEFGFRLLDDLRVVLDLSDLLAWFGTARSPSGIQRVQLGLARALVAGEGGSAEVTLAVFRDAAWRALPVEVFHRLAALSGCGADPRDPDWTEAVATAEAWIATAPALAWEPGAWLVNPGSSWWLPGYHQAVRDAGALYAALVHDTGPVTCPEHSEPAVTARFARWFSSLGTQADLLLAVSEATRRDMLALACEDLPGLPFAPVGVLRPDAAPPMAGTHPRVAALAPYILFVSTIESRKDHLFVLQAWLTLLRRHGAAVPRLLLVGRAGFDAGPALEMLRRAPALDGRVLWLDDVDDAQLGALTRGALFAIYNSWHEGWGLPVTEALAAGKAVVAPAHSGLLEAGQGLVLPFEAGSEPQFLAAVEGLLFQPGLREAVEAKVAAGLRLRSWGAIAADLLAQLAAAAPRDAALPAPPLGLVHRLGEGAALRPSAELAWAERLRLAGWQAPEAWGCATRPGSALLRLALPAGTGGPLRLHLVLRGGEGAQRVTLRLGEGPHRSLAVAGQVVAVLEMARVSGAIELAIEAPEGIGVVAVMACAPDDLAARLGLLEQLCTVLPLG